MWLTDYERPALTQRYVVSEARGGVVLDLRSVVIALFTSIALVVVLGFATAGVFSTPATPSAEQATPVSVPINPHGGAPSPIPANPPAVAPPLAPVKPAAPAPVRPPAPPALVNPPVPAAQPQPVSRVKVVEAPDGRPAPVTRQPVPVEHPVPAAPERHHEPDSPPPSSAMRDRDTRSHTVNTEPCACDGSMRRVSTHWDPPAS
jgi:hypothetical protein